MIPELSANGATCTAVLSVDKWTQRLPILSMSSLKNWAAPLLLPISLPPAELILQLLQGQYFLFRKAI